MAITTMMVEIYDTEDDYDDNYSWCIGKIHKMKCITIAFTNKT